jgi:nucleoside permease NupC
MGDGGVRDIIKFVTRDRFMAMFLAAAVGVGGCVLFASQFHGSTRTTVLATSAMTAFASLLVSAVVGFLFGVPRYRAAGVTGAEDGKELLDATEGRFIPNSNLEQLSDWLTKILVGVGLTQFGAIGDALGRLLNALGPAFGGTPASEIFAGALLAYTGAVGFLAGYVLTAIFLGRTLSQDTIRRLLASDAAAVAAPTAPRAGQSTQR